MKRLPGCLLLLLLALCVATARAQRQPALGIAFYDLDGLYDTIPALFYDDSDHTPRGRLAWDSERYRRKIAHTAAVIDSMGLPLVALYGVENEAVVRDLSAACRGDYSYLHSTMNAFDGLDFALLYYGDLFRPLDVEQGRDYLCIEGVLRSDTLALVLSCDYRMARWAVRELRHDRPGLRLLVAGRTPHRVSATRCAAPNAPDAATCATPTAAGTCATASSPTRRSRSAALTSTPALSSSTSGASGRFPPTGGRSTSEVSVFPCQFSFISAEQLEKSK